MASPSAPQPGVDVKVTNEPAVAAWECIQRNETRFLIHFDPLCRVTCDLRAEHNSAFLRFRIPFMPNNSVRAKPLFLHVPPDRIESARIKSDVPAPVRDRLGEAIGLRLDLRQNPIVVIPSAPLVPKDQSTEDAVDALHSLALTTCFAVYFRKSVMHSAETFVRAVSAGIVQPHPGLADVASLYSGRGGLQIEGSEFTPSRVIAAATASPPSYDELALTPPEPVQKAVAKKRRRRSPSDEGQSLEHMVQDMKKGLTGQFTDMVSHLGQQLEGRLLKRLDERLDARCEVLRVELSHSIKAEIMSKVEERMQALDEENEDLGRQVRQLSRDIDDAKDEVDEIVDLRVDDQITAVKEELRAFVKEELKDVEDRVKDDITDGKVSIVFES
ncbi:hypothetical protein SLS58_011237 [Diplodia intermedia]|uniref:Uncharacterized protein n=1 Tax=Diplodia intermedia TaxID=856260 RepID=A0ABR3T0C6_9PEZI